MSTKRSAGEWTLAVRQQAALAHLGQTGLRGQDRREVLDEALVVAADTLGITEAVLFEVAVVAGELRGLAGIDDGHLMAPGVVAELRLPAGPDSLGGFALQQGEPVASNDLGTDDRFDRASMSMRGARSAVAAPIAWSERSFGVVVAYDREPRLWSDDEVHFMASVGATIGLVVQRFDIERALRESSARLDLSLSAGGLGAWSWNVAENSVALTAAALDLYGLTPDSFDATGEAILALAHPEDRDRMRRGVIGGFSIEEDEHQLYRIIRPDNGEVRWIESWGRLVERQDEARHLVGVSRDVTEGRRAEALRESILASEHSARLEAEAARERLAYLSEASAVLSESLDPAVSVAALADLCVPGLGDVCVVDLVGDNGLPGEHVGRALEPALAEAVSDALGSARNIADGAQIDGEMLALVRDMGARSCALVALVARGRTIGTLALVRMGNSPGYSNDDLPLLNELARRAALAIDNAKLFHSRNRVARSLQEALLPPALPKIDGLELAARYQVAEADVAIGGDFYDVIALGENLWGVVVGDVCGRGPDAAALTLLVRHSLRTAVVREQRPSRVLAQTNEAVLDQIDDSRFCTLAYLRVEVAESVVRVLASSAGHPRPVLVRAGGQVDTLDCGGTLLGVVPDPLLVDASVVLEPGDSVVLYTDGITEARRDGQHFGEDRLLAVLSQMAGSGAQAIAQALEDAVASFGSAARDDTAIVVMTAVRRSS